MLTIWKFPLAVMGVQRIKMPKGAEILTIQPQGDKVCLWALVDSEREIETRVIEVHGTGNPMDNGPAATRKYIGTFQVPPYVWHVFESTL